MMGSAGHWVEAEGGPHSFPGDVRMGMVGWLMALAITTIAILLFRRSSRSGTASNACSGVAHWLTV